MLRCAWVLCRRLSTPATALVDTLRKEAAFEVERYTVDSQITVPLGRLSFPKAASSFQTLAVRPRFSCASRFGKAS